MSKELTISEKYILMEMIFAEVFYFLQLAVFLYLIRRWYRGDEAVRVKLKVPEKRDTLLRHDWKADSPALTRSPSGTRLNPPKAWFTNYNNQSANEILEGFMSLEQCEITPTVKLSDLSIGSELSVRRRKREGLAKRPPGETSDQHNLHNAPSSLGIHNEEWL
ncbi:hypothetical protein ECG_09743 [Echinococcus granulosus]|nr:hypothetical protein ECG_09743 [Echinococcus granulosus]